MLAAVALALIGLLVWAGLALLSWLWAQGRMVTDAGVRAADGALTQVEQVVPGFKDQAGQWLPAVTEQLDRWLPGLTSELYPGDAKGADVSPVPRYPGLVRSYFVRGSEVVEVHYKGPAAFDAVLAHYVEGFMAAGYLQEGTSAMPAGEQHRFRRGQEAIDLAVLRRPGGRVEIQMKRSPQ